MKVFPRSSRTREMIELTAQSTGLQVEYSPVGPTIVTLDERLIVHAPFYPIIGRGALSTTIKVVTETKPYNFPEGDVEK